MERLVVEVLAQFGECVVTVEVQTSTTSRELFIQRTLLGIDEVLRKMLWNFLGSTAVRAGTLVFQAQVNYPWCGIHDGFHRLFLLH